MTRNLDSAARCPKCSGLVAAGRACKRCKSLEAAALRNIQREDDRARDQQRVAQESAAATGARRIYLARYVSAVLARDGAAKGSMDRVEYMDRNPLEIW